MRVKPGQCILLTGFEPFAGEKINPSWEIVRALPEDLVSYRVEKRCIPVQFGLSIIAATEAIEKLKPTLVLCLGEAGNRSHMSVERIAINIDDARIADNAGNKPVDEPVHADGPAAYFCSLPIKTMVNAITHKNIPAEVSNSAGTFVCNHLIYGVLHHIAQHGYKIRAGFMHVPYLDEQVIDKPGVPSLPLDTMITATKAAIIAVIRNRKDLKRVGGTLA